MLRLTTILLASSLTFACGDNIGSEGTSVDGGDDPTGDGGADPDANVTSLCDTVILNGDSLPSAQGWINQGNAGAATSLSDDGVQIATTGDQYALISFETGIAPNAPFIAEWRMRVNSASDKLSFEAPVGFMAHYFTNIGNPDDRIEQIYFETDFIGVGDESAGMAFDTTSFNEYRYVFDGADSEFFINDELFLSQQGLTLEETARVAIGDPSNRNPGGVNSDIEISSFRFCPQ